MNGGIYLIQGAGFNIPEGTDYPSLEATAWAVKADAWSPSSRICSGIDRSSRPPEPWRNREGGAGSRAASPPRAEERWLGLAALRTAAECATLP